MHAEGGDGAGEVTVAVAVFGRGSAEGFVILTLSGYC